MSYDHSEVRNNLFAEINRRFPQHVGVVDQAAPTDVQMIGLMRRVEQRFEGFRTAIEEIRKQQSNLLAQLDSMREQRDHWQRMAERLWTNQSGQR